MDNKNNNSETPKSLTLNKDTVDVLVANVIPTTKYFELRFDNMQEQINRIERQNELLRKDMDNRFDKMQKNIDHRFSDFKEDIDRRFEQVDKRFEQIDKRFEQIDKRFEQIDIRLNQIIQSIDGLSNKLDYRDRDQRSFTIKMFMISISVSILGVLGVFFKMMGVFS